MPHGVFAQRSYLFTDLRHILCSDLRWLGPDGGAMPLVPAGEPHPVRSDPYMMPTGIRLVTEPGVKSGPLPPAPYPMQRIVFDQGVYRAWGMRAVESAASTLDICVSESDNGIDWRAVHTCRFTAPGAHGGEGFTVFVDPKAPAAERYKAVFCCAPPPEQQAALFEEYTRVHRHHRIWRFSPTFVFAMYGAVSPDGLDWTPLPEHLMVQYSDTDTSVYYDDELDRYVMYTRLMLQQRRWIGRAVSEDFRHWSPIDPLIGPSLEASFTDDVYQNGFCRYPDEPAYYLMFPMLYHRWDQRSEVGLLSSDDGIAWQRVPGAPLIAPGETGAFDSEFLFVNHDLVPFGTDRLALRYGGTPYPHKYPRWPHVLDAVQYGWASWPKGRLSAVRADGEGRFFTFPFEVKGRALRLNARTATGGEIRVGIVDTPGRSVADCTPITGDGLALPVHWHGEDAVGLPDGQPITLEFRLRAADLFGFEWV